MTMTDEQLQSEVESIFFTQDAREAIRLSRKLKAERVLSDFAKQLLSQLRFIRMASLTEDDLVELLKEHLPVAYSIPDFDLAEKIEWYIDQKEWPPFQVTAAKKIKSVLETHQAHIGQADITVKNKSQPSTIGNWLLDYSEYPSHEGQRDALSELEYINKSPNIKNLAPHEVNVLKNLLKLYDYVTKLVADWDAVPLPKSEAEAFKGFDLYDYIPGIDKNEVEEILDEPVADESNIASASAAPTPNPYQPMPQPNAPLTPLPRTIPNPGLTIPKQRPVMQDVAPKPRPAVKYNADHSAAPPPTAADAAKVRDLINHKPTDRRGVTMDPTNIKIDEEQQRIAQQRDKKAAEIQRKLAALRDRNKQTP